VGNEKERFSVQRMESERERDQKKEDEESYKHFPTIFIDVRHLLKMKKASRNSQWRNLFFVSSVPLVLRLVLF
jgi:hypothetical protein